jgi:hypothetical protein
LSREIVFSAQDITGLDIVNSMISSAVNMQKWMQSLNYSEKEMVYHHYPALRYTYHGLAKKELLSWPFLARNA